MDEIKYRAWDPDSREMLKVDVIVFDPKAILCEIDKPYIYDQYNDLHAIDDVELMQYIGLRDDNHTDIYEGDIVHIWGGGDFFTGANKYDRIIEVKRLGYHDIIAALANADNIEVIGNVYDNPERLGGID